MSENTPIPAPVAAFIDAINAADTEAFVAVFDEAGVVDDWGTIYRGESGVRRWAESDAIGAGARMTLLSATTEKDTTTIRFDWRSRKFNGESTGIFVVSGDRLTSFAIPPEH